MNQGILQLILASLLVVPLGITCKTLIKDDRETYKKILQLAWPSISEQFLVMLVGMITTIFISRLGKQYISSVGVVNMLFSLYQVIFAALSTGCTVLIARFYGQNKHSKVISTLFQSIVIGMATAILFYLMVSIFYKQIIDTFYGKMDKEVLNLTYTYYKSTVIGIPFIVMDLIISGAQKGSGDTKTPMFISIFVNIINIVLNIFLVHGMNLGFINIVGMGLTGAAIAVNTARIVGACIKFLTLFSKKRNIHFDLKMKYTIDVNIIKRIFKIGIPSFLENFIMQGGFLFLQILIVSIGTDAMAGYQIGGNIHNIAFMPIMGLAITTTTLVGQSLGMEDYNLAEKYANYTTKLSIIIGLLMAILQISFLGPLLSLYTNDQNVIPYAVTTLIGFSIVEPFIGLSNTIASTLRAAGDLKYILLTSLVAFWTFRIGVSYVLINFVHIGLIGVLIGVFLDFSIRAFLYTKRMKKGRWKYLKV